MKRASVSVPVPALETRTLPGAVPPISATVGPPVAVTLVEFVTVAEVEVT